MFLTDYTRKICCKVVYKVRLLNLQLPPLCMPSLQTGWTTVARSTLASLLVDWGPWIGSCVLLPAQSVAYLNLAMLLNTCLMFFTDSLPNSGFHIGLLPWFGAAQLALLLSTYVNSVVLLLLAITPLIPTRSPSCPFCPYLH